MAGESPVVAAAVSEAVDRKRRSEELLRKHNIVVPPELPRLVSTKEVRLRDAEEVARRLMAVCIIAARAETAQLPVAEVLKLIAQRGLTRDLTSAEQVFLGTPAPDEKARQQYLWRYEGAWMLLWVLGYVKTPGEMGKPCDIKTLVNQVVPKSLVTLLEKARMRSAGEIMDMVDYAYRLHWAARSHLEKQNKPLDGVMVRVVYERHYALNWVIRRGEWDGPVV